MSLKLWVRQCDGKSMSPKSYMMKYGSKFIFVVDVSEERNGLAQIDPRAREFEGRHGIGAIEVCT